MPTYRLVESDLTEHSLFFAQTPQRRELVAKVWEKTGVPWNYLSPCQRLFVRGSELDLSEFEEFIGFLPKTANLEDGDVIHLVDNPRRWDEGNTHLHNAAYYNNPKALKVLIEKGEIEIDQKTDNEGHTALHDLALKRTQNVECIEILMGVGADASLENDCKETPLQLAEGRNASILLMCGAYITPSVLETAVNQDKENKVSELIESGSDVNKDVKLPDHWFGWRNRQRDRIIEVLAAVGSEAVLSKQC